MTNEKHPILSPAQAAYLERLAPRDSEIVREMADYAADRGIPISRTSIGRLLAILVRATGATRAVEVGTGIGHATYWLASSSESMRVVTFERDSDRLETARKFLSRAGVGDRVELICGEAVELLPRLTGPVDLVFLDGDKQNDRRCLDLALRLLRVGGLAVVDHLLWRGKVADPDLGQDDSADAAHAFNGYFTMHPQLASLLMPLEDGVGLAVKVRPLVTDLGGPFP